MGTKYLFLLVLLLFTRAAAQETKQTGAPAARLDTLRAEGYEALYNLDYEGARRNFTELIRLFPSHPAGPQSIAATLWLKQLNQSWKLKASLYNNESYADSKERVDQKVIEEFRDSTRRAKSLAEARLRQDPNDLEALYFLGATEGLESAFAAGVERRFMAALRTGSRSVDRHRDVLKRAPDYRDAELTIGLYNYIVGSLPLAVKIVAGTMGFKGSKKRGLEALERVAKEGHWSRDIARVLLVDLYKREKRWRDSAAVATELSARYPRNYFFKLQIADALSAELSNDSRERRVTGNSTAALSADQQRVFDIFESLLKDRSLSTDASEIVRFRYGEALLAAEHYDRAVSEFQTVARRTSESGLSALSRLRAAHSLDLAGKRPEALTAYRAILTAPDIFYSHEHAKRGLRERYKLK
jgi:tetratricopeptide (TPR) repeat protein